MWFRFCKLYTHGSISSLCFDFGFFGIVFDVLTYNISPANVEVMISKQLFQNPSKQEFFQFLSIYIIAYYILYRYAVHIIKVYVSFLYLVCYQTCSPLCGMGNSANCTDLFQERKPEL